MDIAAPCLRDGLAVIGDHRTDQAMFLCEIASTIKTG